MSRVSIIGAGLAGSLLAIYLARRDIKVDVYEARGDMRLEKMSAGRSINLALSDRGIAALREVGMARHVLSEAVPMYGRKIHAPDGGTKLLSYSGREGEHINSVSRGGLNIALMNAAERQSGVTFHFNHRCTGFDSQTGEVRFADGKIITTDTVIATDGAGSPIRRSMFDGVVDRFNFSQIWLEHGYKELHIPAGSNAHRFAIEPHALHIWPRHKFMMIALPNFDGSFTCTLFLAHHGSAAEPGFDQLTDPTAVSDFFTREFPDAVPLMPTLADDFFANPTGDLGTVKCWPWHVGGKALLLGDSAHAVVPFYGQGMNCAFEDVRILDTLIDEYGVDWASIYPQYAAVRKPNTDAIAEMAEENFYEMRDATADPVFQSKRIIETRLENTFPDYFSKYSMVTFREDLPYSLAKQRGNVQDEILMEIAASTTDPNTVDLNEVRERLKAAQT
ncbi:MAG: FAD-dependent monooxygenase [Blastocatellia bacterium]|nr:FAD-dependent monooxygenase [Blastocatellia bacterium]